MHCVAVCSELVDKNTHLSEVAGDLSLSDSDSDSDSDADVFTERASPFDVKSAVIAALTKRHTSASAHSASSPDQSSPAQSASTQSASAHRQLTRKRRRASSSVKKSKKKRKKITDQVSDSE